MKSMDAFEPWRRRRPLRRPGQPGSPAGGSSAKSTGVLPRGARDPAETPLAGEGPDAAKGGARGAPRQPHQARPRRQRPALRPRSAAEPKGRAGEGRRGGDLPARPPGVARLEGPEAAGEARTSPRRRADGAAFAGRGLRLPLFGLPHRLPCSLAGRFALPGARVAASQRRATTSPVVPRGGCRKRRRRFRGGAREASGSGGGGAMAALPGSASAAAAPGLVVLASARAWVPRPPPSSSPALAAPGGRDAQRLLRLQLSAGPGPGPDRFRLGLRGGPDSGPEPSLVEYSLRDISYEVKTGTCHELKVLARPDDPLVFHFEDEHEAQKWWAVVGGSLREAHKEGTNGITGRPSSQPLAAVASLPLEVAKKEDLALHLSAAIEFGDEEEAMRCASLLAQQHSTLRILLKESCYPASQISMKVQVEDASCSASITTRVQTHTTIATLRQQVFQDYGFHPSVQRWIIGQCLCVDDRTVGSYGIRKDGDTAFLYLLSAKRANLSEQRYKEDKDWVVLQPPPLSPPSSSDTRHKGSANPLPKKGGKDLNKKRDVGEVARFLDSVHLSKTLPCRAQAPATTAAAPASPVQAGWSCPICTFINKPTRPGCEMCSTDRPAGYVVPVSYRPDDLELWRMQQEKEGILQYQKALEQERLQNFQQLCQLEEEALVPNQQEMECRICYLMVEPGNGVLLRECLHSFCRACLRQLINCSQEPQVACPFRDDAYACNSHLQDREIRALVAWDEYERFLERRLAVAESRTQNSYHCRTADCPGWCIYEDDVNEFRCPICWALNCLICKAIHEGMNCKQYQDKLQSQAHNDAAARKTSNMLKMLVQLGEAMHCPACHIVVQKKGGCDWIRCPVCQTEICWGPGDTNGGCRCNVDGERCHPMCQNCH